MNNQKFNTKRLEEVEFGIEIKGYDVNQVDELIDEIINERKMLKAELTELIKDLQETVNNL